MQNMPLLFGTVTTSANVIGAIGDAHEYDVVVVGAGVADLIRGLRRR